MHRILATFRINMSTGYIVNMHQVPKITENSSKEKNRIKTLTHAQVHNDNPAE